MSSLQHFAIILAAGASQRMGTCKTALPWQGSTLLQYQVQQFLIVGVTPIIVLGPHNRQRQQNCPPESQVVINPTPQRGKTSSIQTGLQALPSQWQTLFISAVDQPRSASVYRTLLQSHQARDAPMTAPTYQGKLGHPLVFSQRVHSALKTIGEETLGLRQIIREFSASLNQVEFTTPTILMDLNTPDSYKALQQ
ncbi:MAG: nucleotidyltransferase family protein [Cyanobacteria bacterium P01_C01_bin.120]